MSITAAEKYLLNNMNSTALKVQLGTLLDDASNVVASEVALAEGKMLVGNSSGVASALTLTSGQIVVGNGTTGAAAASVSGDVTLSSAGVTAIGANKVTKAMLATDVCVELTGTLTQANLLAVASLVEAIPAPGAGKVIVVDEVELFHSYSTTQYADGSDLALEYGTSGDNIALVVDSFVTASSSSSKIIKPSTYGLDGSTGTAAGFDVTANANKAVNFQATNFTAGHASNVIKWRIRYHVITLLT